MRTFTFLLLILSFCNAKSEHTFTTIGIVTDVSHGDIMGLDKLVLSINDGVKKMSFWFQVVHHGLV